MTMVNNKERIHYIRKVSNFVELSDEEKRLSKTSQQLLVGKKFGKKKYLIQQITANQRKEQHLNGE